MTYCLGIVTRSGLVMAADSRTNAGVDNVSTYRKLFDFSLPGDRVLLLCTSGNLSATQAVIAQLEKDVRLGAEPNLHSLHDLYDVAHYVGKKVRQVQDLEGEWLQKNGVDFSCNLLLGGQMRGEAPKLFLIYSQGNCIQATVETPFLQIGETKYGKPILDRTITFETHLDAAAMAALLSLDSTMKSNISVGPPIDLLVYRADSFVVRDRLRLAGADPYLTSIRQLWGDSLTKAFGDMPEIDWSKSETPEAVKTN